MSNNLAFDFRLPFTLNTSMTYGNQFTQLDIDEDNDEDVDDNEIDKMYILGSDGKPQMDLVGGERIISRVETKSIIIKAKKANKSKSNVDYKKLGKYLFKVFSKQDDRDPEYTSIPDNKKGEQ